MQLSKKNILIALAVAVGVVVFWYAWRSYNTKKTMADLGILINEMEQLDDSDASFDPSNWEGYEAGDPIPDAAKE